MSKTLTLTLDEDQLRAALSLLNWSRAIGFVSLLHGRPRKDIQAEIDATNAVIRQIRRAIAPKAERPAPPPAEPNGCRVPKAEALAIVHASHAKRKTADRPLPTADSRKRGAR